MVDRLDLERGTATYSPAREGGATSATHYRAVWRWHFYAGLFVAPVLVLLAITGALYLFDRELEGWWNHEIQTVSVGARSLPLADQEAAVRTAYPAAQIDRVRLPRAEDQASRWLITKPEGSVAEIFLDPYSGRITGEVDPSVQPMAIVRKIHGTLLAGDLGSYLVELTACWTLVMLATGLYLWWPRKLKVKGVIVPRMQAQGRRFWRDLHAIPSAVNALLIIFLVLTGMPWSAFWGHQFAKIGRSIPFIEPTPNFGNHIAHVVAQKGEHDEHASHNMETESLPWVVKNSPQPSASGGSSIGVAEVEKFLPLLEVQRFGGNGSISYPKNGDGVFRIGYIPDKAEGQRTIYIDPQDGRIIDDIGWDQYSPSGKLIEWGTMTHMGRQYGVVNQIVGLFVCFCLIGTVSAGLVLWWRRRPKGTFGAPQTSATDRIPPAVVMIIVGLGILFPLVGASLVVIYLVELSRRALHGRA